MDLEEILEILLEDCDIDDIIIEDYEDFFIIEAQELRKRTRVRFLAPGRIVYGNKNIIFA